MRPIVSVRNGGEWPTDVTQKVETGVLGREFEIGLVVRKSVDEPDGASPGNLSRTYGKNDSESSSSPVRAAGFILSDDPSLF
jgi:hypothetical protein